MSQNMKALKRCFPIPSFISLAENFGKWRPYLELFLEGGRWGQKFHWGPRPPASPWNRPCKEHINAPNSEVCGDLFEDNVSGAFGRWSHGHVRLPVYDVLDGLAGLQAACGVNESCGDVLTDHLSQSNTTDLKSSEHRNRFRKKPLQTASKSAVMGTSCKKVVKLNYFFN